MVFGIFVEMYNLGLDFKNQSSENQLIIIFCFN